MKTNFFTRAAALALAGLMLAAPLPVRAGDSDLDEVREGSIDLPQGDTAAEVADAPPDDEVIAGESNMRRGDDGVDGTAAVGDWDGLKAAVENAAVHTIVIADDIQLEAKLDINRNLTFKAVESQPSVTLYSAAGQRHMKVWSGCEELLFEDVILDGNSERGGIDVATTPLIIGDAHIANTWSEGAGSAISIIGGPLSEIKNVTIRGGTFIGNETVSSSSSNPNGGGNIHASHTNLTLEGPIRFSGNKALKTRGGAIYIYGRSRLQLSGDITFEGNRAHMGGGIYFHMEAAEIPTTLELSGPITFVGNAATASAGAVYCDWPLVVNSGVRFTNNSSGALAGAVYASKDLTVSGDVVFSGNESGSSGGALYSNGENGSLASIADGVLFDSNRAQSNGGAIYFFGGDPRVSGDVQFTSNTAGNRGGAIDSQAHLTVGEGVVFTKNSAKLGGAIGVFQETRPSAPSSSLTIKDVSILQNTASEMGGAIFTQAPIRVERSLLDENSAQSGGAIGVQSANYATVVASAHLLRSKVSNNKAVDGGAVYTDKLSAFTADDVTFEANRADRVYLWELSGSDGATHEANIVNCTFTSPFANAYSNADVNYTLPNSQVYIVTFDSRSGSAVESQGVTPGGYAAEPAAPTRQGYTFGGWYRDAGCTGEPWVFDMDRVNGHITLYAGWTQDGGSAVKPPPTGSGGDGAGDEADPDEASAAPVDTEPPLAGLPADADDEPLPTTGAARVGTGFVTGLLMIVSFRRLLRRQVAS